MSKNRNYALDVSSAASKTSSKVMLTRGTVNDIVSRNITMVLENLLMNYENNQLPTHGKGKEIIIFSFYFEHYFLNRFLINFHIDIYK